MTALHLQKLDVADCEAALERGYFDWGRGWAKDSPEPDWDEASPQQRRAIALRGYGLYDGLPPQLGNRLGWLEIYASVGINSRAVVYDAVRFLRRSEEAQLLLGGIPDHTALEDGTESQIAAAADLIDLFGRESQIGRSKATKVLYKKRPMFIPVIDSVVGDFLWKTFPHLLTQESSSHAVLCVYRSLLVARTRELRPIGATLAERGFALSAARIISFLIWLGWRGHLDQYGFGRPFVQEWGASSLPGVRSMARELWEQRV